MPQCSSLPPPKGVPQDLSARLESAAAVYPHRATARLCKVETRSTTGDVLTVLLDSTARRKTTLIFRQHFDIVSGTHTYLIVSRRGGEALIIDPVLWSMKRHC